MEKQVGRGDGGEHILPPTLTNLEEKKKLSLTLRKKKSDHILPVIKEG